ncbi:MAG: hypothetical protein ABR548_07085 [Actinomycetota bacterium]
MINELETPESLQMMLRALEAEVPALEIEMGRLVDEQPEGATTRISQIETRLEEIDAATPKLKKKIQLAADARNRRLEAARNLAELQTLEGIRIDHEGNVGALHLAWVEADAAADALEAALEKAVGLSRSAVRTAAQLGLDHHALGTAPERAARILSSRFARIFPHDFKRGHLPWASFEELTRRSEKVQDAEDD